MAEGITIASDVNFENEVLNSDIPVLVDFWAPWCGPCVALAPTIEQIAADQQGKIKVCKLNVDDNPNTAAKYGIRGIPTLIFFKGGEVVNQLTGAVPRESIEEMIKS